jgi:hypothetical protein
VGKQAARTGELHRVGESIKHSDSSFVAARSLSPQRAERVGVRRECRRNELEAVRRYFHHPELASRPTLLPTMGEKEPAAANGNPPLLHKRSESFPRPA